MTTDKIPRCRATRFRPGAADLQCSKELVPGTNKHADGKEGHDFNPPTCPNCGHDLTTSALATSGMSPRALLQAQGFDSKRFEVLNVTACDKCTPTTDGRHQADCPRRFVEVVTGKAVSDG